MGFPNVAERDPLPPGCSEGRWWHTGSDGRVVCDLCPRGCQLREGQRGFCFVRQALDGRMVLTSYGRNTGMAVDPIEKKPLNHFLPGSSVLSFGTAGCSLACRFCQNWPISKTRDMAIMSESAPPEAVAKTAVARGCRSVAFTYNEPVIFAEYAIDCARAAHDCGLKTVAVTSGYISASARPDFYRHIDAANVDLKALSDTFYRRLCAGSLAPVLDTLRWLAHETDVWLEVTHLIIPGHNDEASQVERLVEWALESLGPEVPLHFTAFHPAFRMGDVPATPSSTLRRARRLAQSAGMKYVYTGNVFDPEGASTYCAGCGSLLIHRRGYSTDVPGLDASGRCIACGAVLPGCFA